MRFDSHKRQEDDQCTTNYSSIKSYCVRRLFMVLFEALPSNFVEWKEQLRHL